MKCPGGIRSGHNGIDIIIPGCYSAAMPKTIPTKTGKALAAFQDVSQERLQYAKAVYDHQNHTAQDAIDRIQSVLIRQARRRAYVGENKTSRVVVELPNDAIWNNALYMAIEIMKDLAYMDIRVSGFTWPPDLCIECGKPIKRHKRGH